MGGEGASCTEDPGPVSSLFLTPGLPQPGPHGVCRCPPRLPRETVAFREELDVLKFLCKDLWVAVFHKQMDSLRTNHQVRAPRPESGQRPEPPRPREGDPGSGQSQQAQPPSGPPHKPHPGQAPCGWLPCLGLTLLVCTQASFPLGAHAGPGWWPNGLGCTFSPLGTLEVVQQRGGAGGTPGPDRKARGSLYSPEGRPETTTAVLREGSFQTSGWWPGPLPPLGATPPPPRVQVPPRLHRTLLCPQGTYVLQDNSFPLLVRMASGLQYLEEAPKVPGGTLA